MRPPGEDVGGTADSGSGSGSGTNSSITATTIDPPVDTSADGTGTGDSGMVDDTGDGTGTATGMDETGTGTDTGDPPETGHTANALVNAGTVSLSPSFRLVWTLGQETQNQNTMDSPSFTLHGGFIGAAE